MQFIMVHNIIEFKIIIMFTMNFIILVDGEFELFKSVFPLLESNSSITEEKNIDTNIESSSSIIDHFRKSYDSYDLDGKSEFNMTNNTALPHNLSTVNNIQLHFKDILNFRKPTFKQKPTKVKPKIIYTLLKETDFAEATFKTTLTGHKTRINTLSSNKLFQKQKSARMTEEIKMYLGDAVPTEYLLPKTTDAMETQILPTVALNSSYVMSLTDVPHIINNKLSHHQNKSAPNSFNKMFNFKKSKLTNFAETTFKTSLTGHKTLINTLSSNKLSQKQKSARMTEEIKMYLGDAVPTGYLLPKTTDAMETQILPTVALNSSYVMSLTDVPYIINNKLSHHQNKSAPNSFIKMFNFKKSKLSSYNESYTNLFNYLTSAGNYTEHNGKFQSNEVKLENNFHLKDIFKFTKSTSNTSDSHFFGNNVLRSTKSYDDESVKMNSNSYKYSSLESPNLTTTGTDNGKVFEFVSDNIYNSWRSNYTLNCTQLSNYESANIPSETPFNEEQTSFDNWLFEMPIVDIRNAVGSTTQKIDEGNIFNWYFKPTLEYGNLSNSYPYSITSNVYDTVHSNEKKLSNVQSSKATIPLLPRNKTDISTSTKTNLKVSTGYLTYNNLISNVVNITIPPFRGTIATQFRKNLYDKIKYGMLPRKLLTDDKQNYSVNTKTGLITLGYNTITEDEEVDITKLNITNFSLIIQETTPNVNVSSLSYAEISYLNSKPNESDVVRPDSNVTKSNAKSNDTSFDLMAYLMKPVDSFLSAIKGISPNNITKFGYLNASNLGNVSLPILHPSSNSSLGVIDVVNASLSSEIHESKISLLELFGGWFHCILESFTEPTLHDVHFFLYTRNNIHTPEELFFASDGVLHEYDSDIPEPVFERESQETTSKINKIRRQIDENYNFEHLNPAKTDIQSKWLNVLSETKVVVHGYVQDYQTDIMVNMKDAFLKKGDMNVIVVDWSVIGDNTCYPQVATKALRSVGLMLARLLDHLVEGGLSLGLVHMVGFSLGAHVLGHAGTLMRHGMAARITGLDPALPYVPMDPEVSLDAGDAMFVDIIHTAAGYLGQPGPMGHVDFYPNGGSRQPGCDIASLGMCSHRRSALYFIESITSVVDFWATACDSWHDFQIGRCNQSQQTIMGNSCPRNASGKFYLVTGQKEPFAQLPEEHVKVKKSLLFDLLYE